jgi:hypothetical protein
MREGIGFLQVQAVIAKFVDKDVQVLLGRST